MFWAFLVENLAEKFNKYLLLALKFIKECKKKLPTTKSKIS